MSNVTKLKVAKVAKVSRKPAHSTKARRMQRYGAYGTASVALVLQGLSLTHLASGIAGITGQPMLQGTMLAAGIDCGFIALEIAAIVAIADIKRLAQPMAIALIVLSSILNAYSMAEHAQGTLDVIVAAALGAIIPALVWVLTKVSVKMLTGHC